MLLKYDIRRKRNEKRKNAQQTDLRAELEAQQTVLKNTTMEVERLEAELKVANQELETANDILNKMVELAKRTDYSDRAQTLKTEAGKIYMAVRNRVGALRVELADKKYKKEQAEAMVEAITALLKAGR